LQSLDTELAVERDHHRRDRAILFLGRRYARARTLLRAIVLKLLAADTDARGDHAIQLRLEVGMIDAFRAR
jgi:hypothetical protein